MEVQYKDFVARVQRDLTMEQRQGKYEQWKDYLNKKTTRRALLYFGVGTVILIVAIGLWAGTANNNKSGSVAEGEFGGTTWDPNDPLEDQDDDDWTPHGPLTTDDDDYTPQDGDESGDGEDDVVLPVEFIDPFPLSRLDPVRDIGMHSMDRSENLSPHLDTDRIGPNGALPTNAWYQNLMETPNEPNQLNRAYAVPYYVDTVGPIPGLRILPTYLVAAATNVRVAHIGDHGLTLGIDYDPTASSTEGQEELVKGYSPLQMTNLGLTMQWEAAPMKSTVVRGMAFVTMMYDVFSSTFETTFPTVASGVGLAGDPIIDGDAEATLTCDNGETSYKVTKEIQLQTTTADFTWLVFVSEPVHVKCFKPDDGGFEIQVVQLLTDVPDFSNRPLILRAALLNNCTSGTNRRYCETEDGEPNPTDEIDAYASVLRKGAGYYPGENNEVHFYASPDLKASTLVFDWDVQVMESYVNQITEDGDPEETEGGMVVDVNPIAESRSDPLQDNSLIDEHHVTFALPHHLDQLDESVLTEPRICTGILSGQACLVKGAAWHVEDRLVPVKYRAQRWPDPAFMPDLIDAVQEDLQFEMPWHYEQGMGDTYFSAKMLARQGRVLLIAEELIEICTKYYPTGWGRMDAACKATKEKRPTSEDIRVGVERLEKDLSIWIDLTSSTPLVYDNSWGGVVSCGCYYDSANRKCKNEFPNCPSAYDSYLNFGNGIYNDHHFHYGYMIYAAAVVTRFDPQWGVDNYEYIMLLIRNVANPSDLDPDFPVFRHKDWYAGHSWASGIVRPPFPLGKNQESSSEAIAAYEAIALFGDALRDAEMASSAQKAVARQLSIFGRILTSTEIRSTDKYFHVRQKDEAKRIYPSGYTQNVVGILWSTAVQYTTWFGNQPYYIYGIQMLPYTPVSEFRDDLEWTMEMYEKYADACNNDPNCGSWALLQYMALATVGHRETAARRVKAMPPSAFKDAGGNGHSLTNTLYYIATRPKVKNPITLPQSDINADAQLSGSSSSAASSASSESDAACGVGTCTSEVLNAIADGHTCRSRIHWMTTHESMSDLEACAFISNEYPDACGACNPEGSL